MSNFSITTLFRQPFVLDHFVSKPQDPSDTADYKRKVEVFAYNTTANIANAAVVTAVGTAAAAMFSVINPLFATLAIGTSVAMQLHAKNALPRIYKSTSRDQMVVVLKDPTSTVHIATSNYFGISTDQFRPENGKAWAQFCKVAGFTIWANTLPTSPIL